MKIRRPGSSDVEAPQTERKAGNSSRNRVARKDSKEYTLTHVREGSRRRGLPSIALHRKACSLIITKASHIRVGVCDLVTHAIASF